MSDLSIKLDIDGQHWSKQSELLKIYKDNKEALRTYSLPNGKSGKLFLVAMYSHGYCTLVSENTEAIIQCWAGELVLV